MAHIQIDDREPYIAYTVGGTPQTEFDVPFAYFSEADLRVYVDEVLLTLETDYTVDGEAVDAGFSGGTITLTDAVSNVDVEIENVTPMERTSDYPDAGPFSIRALNTDLDKLVAMVQQLSARLDRDNIDIADGMVPDGSITAAKLASMAGLSLYVNLASGTAAPAAVSLVNFGKAIGLGMTRADIPTRIIPVSSFRLDGFRTIGDGGAGAPYKVGTVAGPLAIQDAAGTWFELHRNRGESVAAGWFGTYADDTTHPLSATFANLVAAQLVYPHAVALSDETDWAAIQGAINFVDNVAYGGVVRLSVGIHRTNRALTVSGNYITVEGESYVSSLIKRSHTTDDTIRFSKGGGVNTQFFCGLRNITFESTTAMTAGSHVKADILSHSKFENLRVDNGFIGVHLVSVHDFHLENVNVVHGTMYPTGGDEAFAGIYFDNDSAALIPRNNAWLHDCNVRSRDDDDSHVEHAIYISSSDGIWMDQVHAGNSSVANLYLNPKTNTTQLSGVTCNNCWWDQGGAGRGVLAAGETSASYGYLLFSDCFCTGGGTMSEGYRFAPTTGTRIRHVDIVGGYVHFTQSTGIQFQDVHDFGIKNVAIRGVGEGGGAHGIQVLAGCRSFTINNVRCGYKTDLSTDSEAGYGLVIAADADDFVVVGNNFRGNTSGGISDLTGGISKKIAENLP
jgi:hypothetical protein